MRIIFEGEFTDLNTYINAERGSRYAGASIKESETNRAYWVAKGVRQQLPRIPHLFTFSWYCINKKKDPDNISGATKFILDGIKEAGIIQTDGWAVVGEIHHRFFVDRVRPRVEVEIMPLAGI